MKRVLLLGSYGQTNLGDDLLMYNYVQFLKERGCEEIIVNASVAKNIPKSITELIPKLTVFETYNASPVQFLNIIKSVDTVVYGGGTVFKELYSSTGRSPYSVIARILAFNLAARLFGKPIYNLHIGTGSIKTFLGRTITKLCLRLSTLTIFRDKTSYDYTRQVLHLPKHKVTYATDGLFLNDIWQKPWKKASLRLPKNRTVIGMNLLSDIPDWVERETYLNTMREFINELLSDDKNFIVFMPLQHDFNPHNDFIFIQNEILPYITKRDSFVLLKQLPLENVSSYFRQLDVFIGMRFHSLLIATVNQVPFVSVSYDTKCVRFLEESGHPYAVKLEQASSKNLMAMYQKLLQKRPEASKLLETITATHFERARRQVEEIEL